jgi:amino acid adenylation domain-containing protein
MENGHPGLTSIETINGSPSMNAFAPDGSDGRFTDVVIDSIPLSYGQRRIWFFEQMESGNPLHHLAYVVRLDGTLNPSALESALTKIIERHQVLRSRFVSEGGEPVQIVSRRWTFELTREDLSGLERERSEEELTRVAREDAGRFFDLRSDVLLRARLVRFDESEHALVLTLHRIAADEMSMTVLFREMTGFYEAFSGGTSPAISELTAQFAEHAARQHEHLQGETLRRLVDFWRDRMAGVPPVISLPTDHSRPSAASHNGATASAVFPEGLISSLNEFSRGQRTTLFMTLLTAFNVLLHRYTGQNDIVVGSPLPGRSRAGMENLIGPFANTLVLRTNLGGDPTFLELLGRVAEATLASGEHQELPFEKLIEELHPVRDLSYESVCQVSFSMKAPDEQLCLGNVRARVEPVRIATTRMDLAVSTTEDSEGLRVAVEYNPELFDAGTVERLIGHFRILLEGVVSDATKPISLLPLLTPEERTLMLSDWNNTALAYPRNTYIHTLFEEQVARTPDSTALIFNDSELSYAGLNRLADTLAATLRAHGAGPDTFVAICADRSLEMVVGIMAVLKSGAAYVPLDPAFPKDRLAFMLEDTAAPVLLTQRHLSPLFPERTGVIFLDEEIGLVDGQAIAPSGQPADSASRSTAPCSENLAYVLYTSGSTGRPKGVMVSHRNTINFFMGMDQVLGRTPGVWLAMTSISFDISVLELLWTLTRGFKVLIVSDQGGMKSGTGGSRMHGDGMRSLDEQLARYPVTHFQCTPSFARMLVRMPATLAALRPLRYMLVGGEGLPADLARVLDQAIDGDLVNMYGPTETTVWSTTHVVDVDEIRTATVDVGRPVANTEIYILDRNQQLVPIGVPGEIHIGGDGVSRGYLHRPELTAEKFIPNPVSSGGERIYRTGDLARYRADGVIEFIGRIDHQVKVRGYRIELGEIEAVLAQHPDVQQSVLVVRAAENNPDDRRLAAYIVPRAGAVQDATVLRDFLRDKLPAHMVPEFFVFLERLPLTPNGKIDRNALPPPGRALAGESPGSSTFVGMEQSIAAIWEEVLGIKNPGPHESFFDLGGHSLQVVEVQNRLHASLGLDLPVLKLFQYPTIRSLADFISSESKEETFLTKIQERARRRQSALANSRRIHAEVKS